MEMYVTVNDKRYGIMLRWYFRPQLLSINLNNVLFQQDGAICHIPHQIIELLQDFPARVIFISENVNWPPRSWDLLPLDFF